MKPQVIYWVDGQWKTFGIDDADTLDQLDSTDFALVEHKHPKSDILNLPGLATANQDGFLSAGDKVKLDTIEFHANHYVHPSGTNPHGTTKYDLGLENVNNWGASSSVHENSTTSYATSFAVNQVYNLANTAITELNNLKSTVVDGKQSVANAINDKSGTQLSNQSSFNELADAIRAIVITNPFGSIPNSIFISGYETYPKYVSCQMLITVNDNYGNNESNIKYKVNKPCKIVSMFQHTGHGSSSSGRYESTINADKEYNFNCGYVNYSISVLMFAERVDLTILEANGIANLFALF